MANVKGKVALVTGAASGVGEATAKRLAREGMSVVATDINEAGLARVAGEIKAEGGTVLAFMLDVTDAAGIAACFTKTIETFGKLDLLVNNAGMASNTKRGDADMWDLGIAATLSSVYQMSQAALPHLESSGGAIVNIASVAGNFMAGAPTWYCAAKAGMVGITRSFASQYGPRGVRTNAICLGGIDTPRVQAIFATLSPETRAAITEKNPLGRLGRPEEIAACVLFLGSDEASFVNGHAMVADGGGIIGR